VRDARARGTPWQAVVDAVRPHVAGVWQRLPPEERTRFLHAHRPEWERLRHRAPSEQVDAVVALEATGRVVRHTGTVHAAERRDGGWSVAIGSAEGETRVEVDAVVLCTGPTSDVRGFGAPWPGLLSAGHVQSDAHGLGVVAGARGEVIGARGPSVGLWALGGLLRARDFESTAVPELARQARSLACALVEALRIER
jgi:uncharacterized NAD(P)/FAD-binding protein YdhS